MANSVEALWVSVRSYEARKTSGVSEQVPLSHRCAAGSLERRGAKKGGGPWLGKATRFEIVKTRTVEKKGYPKGQVVTGPPLMLALLRGLV